MKPHERLNKLPADAIQRRWELFVGPKQPNGCIPWTGEIASNGYGRMYIDGFRVSAHRAAWVAKHGPMPSTCDACHMCDCRNCVNPDHIFPGTRRTNMLDASRKQRLGVQVDPTRIQRGDRHGKSKLTEEAVRQILVDPRNSEELAKHYGVNPSTIRSVQLGRSWQHVERPAAIRAAINPDAKIP